jgi:SAM-dependent methyltransferase
MTTTTPSLDQDRLDAILGRFVADLGAALSAPLIVLGERLGLFAAMADGEPVTPESLAGRTQTSERYVREWLSAMAASGYVTYDEAADTFHLTPEQALTFAQPDGPAYLPGAFELAAAVVKDAPHIERVFRSGEGFGWHEHDHDLFHGTERFFRPGYAAHLAAEWIPALDGVEDKLRSGARVADLGCGHGASTILMAEAYPASSFVGSDYHEASIEHARRAAERAGVADRVRFEVAAADAFTGPSGADTGIGEGYDLVCIFDALHDMGDPVGAARHVREALAPDGTWLVVEPVAGDTLSENLNPVGRIFYSASTSLCVPNALSQGGHRALGAQAGEARLSEVLAEAGFSRVRRAAQTPFNLVLEARP